MTAIVTNRHPRTPLGLPGGILIEPGQSAFVPGWFDLVDSNAVVRSWASKGWLVADAPAPEPDASAAEPAAPSTDERDLLILELEERGIQHDKRWGVKRLKDALDESIAVAGEPDTEGE